MSLHIYISTSSFAGVSREPLQLLESEGMRLSLNPHGRKLRPEELSDLLGDVDGLLAGTERLDRPALAAAPRLRVISRCGVGLDSVDLEAAKEHDIAVFNTPEAHVPAVAELTLAGLLSLLRHVAVSDRRLRNGRWVKPMGRLLAGKSVGLLGLGRVGKAFARLLQPFDVQLLACDPVRDDDFAREMGLQYRSLDKLLDESEILSLHLPASKDLAGLLDEQKLGRMRPGALLLNTARGGLVDEEALARHLRSGHLGGAYLDVFAKEPYEGPLSDLETALITPHIGSYAAEARLRMELEAAENLVRFFRQGTRA